jgi:endonuclease YncB( thermonuclease family)
MGSNERLVRVRKKSIVASAFVAVLLFAQPAQAQDSPKPVIPPVQETGTVVFVGDGDTIDVKLKSGGKGISRVRLLGIQAMEQYTYPSNGIGITGECHSAEANLRLRELIDGKEVQLSSFSSKVKNRGRDYRYVSVYIDGAWRDVGAILVAEGLVLPMGHPTEYSYNWYYMAFSQWAAQRGIGMYDTEHCGAGPEADAKLSMKVHWDGGKRVNNEFTLITNNGDDEVNISGWWIRDSALRGKKGHAFTFPKGSVIKAGASIKVHPGSGKNTKSDYYMKAGELIFEDVNMGKVFRGDGAYLFDTDGDLRLWDHYPVLKIEDPVVEEIPAEVTPEVPAAALEELGIELSVLDTDYVLMTASRSGMRKELLPVDQLGF